MILFGSDRQLSCLHCTFVTFPNNYPIDRHSAAARQEQRTVVLTAKRQHSLALHQRVTVSVIVTAPLLLLDLMHQELVDIDVCHQGG